MRNERALLLQSPLPSLEENTLSIQKIAIHSRGFFVLFCILLNTILQFTFMICSFIMKMILPFRRWRLFWSHGCNHAVMNWISCNNFIFRHTMNIIWRVKGDEGLRYDDWYLVESNHQTWVDFLVVQKVLNRKVPPLKFFAKRQLLWLPFVGLAAWAFDCPFMKRYSKKFIEKHPHLKGKDLEITRKACQKFKEMPTAIMIFIEGTRLTRAKHETQNSPYRFLLKPKSGGIGFVLSSMNGQLNKMLNVTIAYPEGGMSFWEFLCGKVHEVRVDIEIIPLSEIPVWDSMTDDSSRKAFQEWLNNLWKKKDLKITEMLA